MSQNKVHKVRRRLFQFVSTNRLDSIFFEDSCRASCCINTVSKCLKTPCDRNNFLLIFIFDSDDHVLILRKFDSGSDKCFVQSFVEVLCNTKTFTCGLHLWSKADITATDLLEGEYRHLDRDMFCFRLKPWRISHIFEFVSKDHFRC